MKNSNFKSKDPIPPSSKGHVRKQISGEPARRKEGEQGYSFPVKCLLWVSLPLLSWGLIVALYSFFTKL